MSDTLSFKDAKEKMITENERRYGGEIREKYGNATINRANARFRRMTPEQAAEAEKLRLEINAALEAAFEQGDPASEAAQRVCELHKNWLMFYYDGYSREYHAGVAELYANDRRFSKYYDDIAEGCARFLRDAIIIYCGNCDL